MHGAERQPHDADSSGCLPYSQRSPSSPHSHSSSALYTDDASFPLPWRGPGSKRDHRETHYGQVKQEFACSIPDPEGYPEAALLRRPVERKSGKSAYPGSATLAPSRSFTTPHAMTYSPFQGESKGAQSDSDNGDENFTTWQPLDGGQDGSGDSGVKSSYRGMTFDRKKRKWRVQVKVPQYGRSGMSVGYFDTEEAAAQAYNSAKLASLGRHSGHLAAGFLKAFPEEETQKLEGRSREEVKAMLKQGCSRLPRKKPAGRQRTSRFTGVGSSNRKNQWQARILVHGKVTHLGYYETEDEAARVYDRVAISLNPRAQTNFPAAQYARTGSGEFEGLGREELQRALGVKPMDKSSQFRGVSRKKGKWEAKVMVNRKWAYRALFDSEAEAARAYDAALWRLKPKEAVSFVNFKDGVSVRVAKRAPRLSSSLQRSKSQKLDRQSSAGSLPQGSEGILMLMPEDLDETEGPPTPTRRHSVQLPLSQPLECLPIARQCSAVADGLERVASLQKEDLLQLPPQPLPAELSPQQSSFSRRPSYGQLQPALSGVPIMPLPDPNSIGVPPPSEKLPFPELVGGPATAPCAQPEVELTSTPRHLPVGVAVQAPAAAVIQPSTVLPAIPAPLLPAEASRLGMGACYYSGTPLSRGLGQAISASATRLQEFASDEQPCANPFQEAASSLPPISSGSDMLVRVGSEAHVIQDQQPSLQKLNSMTPSLDLFPQRQASIALQRLPSTHCVGLHRAASESLHCRQSGPGTPDMHLSAAQSQVANVTVPLQPSQAEGFQGSTFAELQPAEGILHQQHNHLLRVNSMSAQSSILQAAQVPLQSPQPQVTLHGADSNIQLPRSIFDDYSMQAPFEQEPEGTLSHIDSTTTLGGGALRSCRTASTELLSGLLSGDDQSIHRSVSTSNLAQSRLPYGYCEGGTITSCTASAQMYSGLQSRTSIESCKNAMVVPSGLPPLPSKTPREAADMAAMQLRPSDAAELMAELGVDVSAADCHLPPLHDAHIGGEDLFAQKSSAVRF